MTGPKMRPIVPKKGPMRIAMPPTQLGNALFSTTQQRLLTLLYGNPHSSFYTNEIARWSQVGKGSISRELERLQDAGILTRFRQGNQMRYQADARCPIFEELRSIVLKTFGMAEPLRTALAPFLPRLAWAVIYGSIARGEDTADSDIDLLLIGDGLLYGEVMAPLLPVEKMLGRTINPTLLTTQEWLARKAAGHSFATRVAAQPTIVLIGEEPEFKDEPARKSDKPGSHR
ncbi:winged helix-turn-helix domain-containing protein [Alcanivorax sp. S71-1-4]|uniref:winged helix-turn-helix domain-containing protein n=1 Tax=Alcanivorax sp. S71-1-4 TaxID=1177159 RepID=UPI001F18619F|nr:winged helix-turn-helix domain-containing protein [Alcanivorax sp. S71-1-4]